VGYVVVASWMLFVACCCCWLGPIGGDVVSVVSAVCLSKYYYMILRRVVAIQ